MEIKVMVSEDYDGEPTEMHWISDGAELDDLAVGGSRTLTGESGEEITVTRTEEGMQFDVEGESVRERTPYEELPRDLSGASVLRSRRSSPRASRRRGPPRFGPEDRSRGRVSSRTRGRGGLPVSRRPGSRTARLRRVPAPPCTAISPFSAKGIFPTPSGPFGEGASPRAPWDAAKVPGSQPGFSTMA